MVVDNNVVLLYLLQGDETTADVPAVLYIAEAGPGLLRRPSDHIHLRLLQGDLVISQTSRLGERLLSALLLRVLQRQHLIPHLKNHKADNILIVTYAFILAFIVFIVTYVFIVTFSVFIVTLCM